MALIVLLCNRAIHSKFPPTPTPRPKQTSRALNSTYDPCRCTYTLHSTKCFLEVYLRSDDNSNLWES
eukprot:3389910-Amphidinium_carterae.1